MTPEDSLVSDDVSGENDDTDCNAHRCSDCERVFSNQDGSTTCPHCGSLSNCALRGVTCS